MEQQTGSKSGKECIKAIYCHPESDMTERLKWSELRIGKLLAK